MSEPSMEETLKRFAEAVDDAVPTDDAFVDVKELVERVGRECGLLRLLEAGQKARNELCYQSCRVAPNQFQAIPEEHNAYCKAYDAAKAAMRKELRHEQ